MEVTVDILNPVTGYRVESLTIDLTGVVWVEAETTSPTSSRNRLWDSVVFYSNDGSTFYHTIDRSQIHRIAETLDTSNRTIDGLVATINDLQNRIISLEADNQSQIELFASYSRKFETLQDKIVSLQEQVNNS